MIDWMILNVFMFCVQNQSKIAYNCRPKLLQCLATVNNHLTFGNVLSVAPGLNFSQVHESPGVDKSPPDDAKLLLTNGNMVNSVNLYTTEYQHCNNTKHVENLQLHFKSDITWHYFWVWVHQMPKENNKWCTHLRCILKKNHNPNFYLRIEISDGQTVIHHRIRKLLHLLLRLLRLL